MIKLEHFIKSIYEHYSWCCYSLTIGNYFFEINIPKNSDKEPYLNVVTRQDPVIKEYPYKSIEECLDHCNKLLHQSQFSDKFDVLINEKD